MKVFISWSGARSKAIASALRQWIPDVIQQVQPWMSKADIDAGTRWDRAVDNQLQKTKFGIICLTKDNLNAPWILFEAGALAKTIEDTYVCPYLVDMEPSDIPQGPLNKFQAKKADKAETLELLFTINKALDPESIERERLNRLFEKLWPDLERQLMKVPKEAAESIEKRSEREMLKEVLDIVRQLSRDRRRDRKRIYAEKLLGLPSKNAEDIVSPQPGNLLAQLSQLAEPDQDLYSKLAKMLITKPDDDEKD